MKVSEAEKIRQYDQSNIDNAKSIESRRLLGQFATPPELASDIAKETVPFLTKRNSLNLLEPSAGNGAILSAFLGVPEIQISHATAIELDPDFFESGRRIWKNFPVEYRNADFTTTTPDEMFDLIVANPPYIRHHRLDSLSKKRLKNSVLEETGINISGLASTYCHFILLSLKWMKPGAIATWLIPSEWMSVNYGSALRTFFTEKVRLLRIHHFDAEDVRFTDALVSSCVVWFSNDSPSESVLFTSGSSLINPNHSEVISTEMLSSSEKWPPTKFQTNSNIKAKLRDFFTIRRGIATGDNAYFVLSESDVKAKNLPSEFLKPILPSPRHLDTNCVQSDAQGTPLNIQRLFLFDCTGYSLEAFPESVLAYLAEGEKYTAKRKLCASRIHWFDQEHREPSPILCSYMGRGDGVGAPVRFILNLSKAIATNSYLMLYPKGALRRYLKSHPQDIEIACSILQSIPASEFRRVGRSYGGGLQKMEPGELGNLNCSKLQEWLVDKTGSAFFEDSAEQLLLLLE